MRGSDERSGELFSYVDVEERVPRNHPLRLIRRIVNEVLAALDGAQSCTPTMGVPRLRRSGCCGRCCCRRSTRSARNVS